MRPTAGRLSLARRGSLARLPTAALRTLPPFRALQGAAPAQGTPPRPPPLLHGWGSRPSTHPKTHRRCALACPSLLHPRLSITRLYTGMGVSSSSGGLNLFLGGRSPIQPHPTTHQLCALAFTPSLPLNSQALHWAGVSSSFGGLNLLGATQSSPTRRLTRRPTNDAPSFSSSTASLPLSIRALHWAGVSFSSGGLTRGGPDPAQPDDPPKDPPPMLPRCLLMSRLSTGLGSPLPLGVSVSWGDTRSWDSQVLRRS